jgi:hypothetical protein
MVFGLNESDATNRRYFGPSKTVTLQFVCKVNLNFMFLILPRVLSLLHEPI